MPEALTYIGESAFADCYKLADISIPKNVSFIGERAFQGCSELEKITLPEGIKYIYDYTFESSGLKKIAISSNVKYIGKQAFSSSMLEYVIIPKSIAFIDDNAFAWNENLTDVYYEGTEEEWKEIVIMEDYPYLTKATVHYNYTAPKPIEAKALKTDEGYSFDVTFAKTEIESFETATLLVALYDASGAFIKVEPCVVTYSEDNKIISVKTDKAAKRAVVLLWNTVGGLKPLCRGYEIIL